MPAACNILQQILQLSQQMLKLAESDEWEDIAALDEQRRQLITATFPLSSEQIDAPLAVTVLKQIMELDKSVMALGTDAQQKMGAVLGKIHKGQQAATAYHKVGS